MSIDFSNSTQIRTIAVTVYMGSVYGKKLAIELKVLISATEKY